MHLGGIAHHAPESFLDGEVENDRFRERIERDFLDVLQDMNRVHCYTLPFDASREREDLLH